MRYVLFTVIGLIMLTACASATPTPSPTATPQPTAAPSSNQPLVSTVKAGNWSGGGENNFTISFTVGDGGNAIANGVQVTFKATCGSNASNITETLAGKTNLAFKSGEVNYADANFKVTGRALAADRIEGTFKADGISLGKLGQCSTSIIAWSASPK